MPSNGTQPLTILAGPCILEGDGTMNLHMARELKRIMDDCGRNQVNFYFKSSYDKANRTSITSYRGPGVQEGLDILRRIKDEVGVSIITDVHSPEQCVQASSIADVLQIPAFLCRQTDLLTAAAETGKIVNIKKGQFLSPPEVEFCANKVKEAGNSNVWITERGTTFGYNNLVVDMRCIPIVQSLGLPLILDATHSVQQPGGLNGKSGGNRDYAPILAKAAIAAGCDGLFFETHPNPDQALSDGPNQLPIAWIEELLHTCLAIRQATHSGKTSPSLATV